MQQSIRSQIQLPKIDSISQKSIIIEQLKLAKQEKFNQMLEDKKQTPTLVIPKQFVKFISTSLFIEFLLSIHYYLQEWIKIIKKQIILNKDITGKHIRHHELIQENKNILFQKQKQISIYYSTILLKYTQKSATKDQFFFQTLIYLICRIMKKFYTRQDYPIIQQQTNRIFRTNKYNIIKKRHDQDRILREYPILKQFTDQTKSNHINFIISKVQQKSRVYKQINKRNRIQSLIKYKKDNSFNTLNFEINDPKQRSPILSSWLPSNRSRFKQFSQQQSSRVNSIQKKYTKNGSLDKIENQLDFLDNYC